MSDRYLDDPDVKLMLRVADGDHEAFNALVTRYAPVLVNFMYKYVGSHSIAEDLAQETFLRVFKAASRYRPKAKFRTWLLTIATNQCLNQKRWEAKHFHHSLDAPVESGADRPHGEDLAAESEAVDGGIERDELRHQVLKALGALPQNQRVAVILARYEELSYAEIAAVLGQSIMATKSLLNRAKENLKARLKQTAKEYDLSQKGD